MRVRDPLSPHLFFSLALLSSSIVLGGVFRFRPKFLPLALHAPPPLLPARYPPSRISETRTVTRVIRESLFLSLPRLRKGELPPRVLVTRARGFGGSRYGSPLNIADNT